MCREEAKELNNNVDDLKQAGAKRVVCLLKENLSDQVAEFQKDWWTGELFLDESKSFYKAIAGGQFKKTHSNTSFVCTMLCPCSKDPMKAHAMKVYKNKTPMNFKGEGFIQGGVYVVRKTGVAELGFLEENMGDRCPIDEIKGAVQAAKAA